MNIHHNFTKGAAVNKPLPRLSYDSLKELVPAAFTNQPVPTVSSNYHFYHTLDVVQIMQEQDYYPVRATQPKSSDPYCTHMIAFRRGGNDLVVGDVVPEVVLTNNHKAQRSFSLSAGLFRLACSNGLLMAFSSLSVKTSVVHLGESDIQMQFLGALGNIDRALELLPPMQARAMSLDERINFAKNAALIRENGHPILAARHNPNDLLRPRRWEDEEDNLWAVYNRVQENVIKGTEGYKTLTQVDRVTKINKELWSSAFTMLN